MPERWTPTLDDFVDLAGVVLDAGDTHPVFSADGSRVAFERDGGIWVVDVAGERRGVS